jgi:hypothetical protein
MVLRYRHPFENLERPRLRDVLDAFSTPELVPTRGVQEVTKLLGFGLAGTKFDFMAIGTGSNAPAAGDVALQTEITTGGGARVATAGSLVTVTVANDTVRFIASWTFTASFGVFELGVFNGSVVGDGDPAAGSRMLLRQKFASVLNVVSTDTLELTVDVTSSDEVAAGDSTLTNAGLVEGNKLIALDLTAANGRMRYLAVGSGSTAVAPTQTALVTEITLNGLARQAVDTGTGNSIVLATTNVSNDTVRLTGQWSVTGTQAVREIGVFNAAAGGDMFLRAVFAADLNLVSTDTLTLIVNHVQVP